MPSPEPSDADLAKSAAALILTMEDVVKGLASVTRWRRRFTWTTAVAGMLVVVALAVGGVGIWQNHQQQHATCVDGNQTRAGAIQLWDHILGLARHQTAQQRAAEAAFRGYVHRLYAPRDCG